MANPLDLVERQLAAYNDRNLGAFLSVFSDDIEVVRLPQLEVAISGKAAFERFYAEQRFNLAGLRAEIVSRMVLGNKVIDHERIHGVAELPLELVVIYVIEGGLIRRILPLSSDP